MYCNDCGTLILVDSRFCPQCGARVPARAHEVRRGIRYLRKALFLLVCAVAVMLATSSPDPRRAGAQEGIRLGSEVEVTGVEGCLETRDVSGLGGDVLECIPNGTRARLSDERTGFGFRDNWWFLAGHGWVPEQFLRVTAPPEPELQEYAGPRPFLPGLIAYVRDDDSVWLVRPDGTGEVQVAAPKVGEVLHWSPDGRRLAFLRGKEIGLYDAATGEVRLVSQSGGAFGYYFRWMDERHVWGVYSNRSVESLDVITGEREVVLEATPGGAFITSIGPPSPGGSYVAYAEALYSEGTGFPCALDVVSGRSQCLREGTWRMQGWINEREMFLIHDPYTCCGFVSKPKPSIVFDALTGSTRPAKPGEESLLQREAGPKGGRLIGQPLDALHSALRQEFLLDGKVVLRLRVQDYAWEYRQALAPTEQAFLFEWYDRESSSHSSDVWVALTDGSQTAWRLVAASSGSYYVSSPDVAWQPKALPPVLFIHGCGGGLGTWTDPGWITDTTEIAQFTAGDASGKLYRGVIPETPAVPAYVLDYSGSRGSIFDLAALIPQSIDKIREETDAEKVMLATHSMGGVLAQAYVGGLASGHGYDDDVEASFMVAPPSKGSFLVNWLTGKAGNALACPQASELGPNSQSIARLRAADLPELEYSVVSGTRFWIPFVGLNDGVIADGDVGLGSAGYDKRQVRGTHIDVPLLPNTVAALCETVLSQPCISELRMDEVKGLFRQRYKEDMFK